MRCQQSKTSLAFLAVAFSYAATTTLAWAQSAKAADPAAPKSTASARIEFDHASAGDPTIQVDLPAGLWSDLVGLGDAAVAGVAESLLQAKVNDDGTQAKVKIAADQLAGIHTIVTALQGALGEVRVSVWRGEAAANSASVVSHYSKKLAGTDWAQIAEIHEGDKSASVFIMRGEGAIRGVFVVANQGHELALVNVLCDVSPQRIKEITNKATSIGIQLGGDEALSDILNDLVADQPERKAPATASASIR